MAGSGQIVVIKRDGTDGPTYPVIQGSITIGSNKGCDLRIPVKGLSPSQCSINIGGNNASIKNLSTSTPTFVNGVSVTSKVLSHGDILTFNVGQFRWDYIHQKHANQTTNMGKLKSGIARPKFVVKKNRHSIGKRKSVPAAKKSETQIKKLLSGRNSLDALLGKSRQVAVVKPQMRENHGQGSSGNASLNEEATHTVRVSLASPKGAPRHRTNTPTPARKQQVKRLSTNLVSADMDSSLITNKRRRINDIEKVDTPVIIDKNKRAALMLLTGKSPKSRTSLMKSAPSTIERDASSSTNVQTTPVKDNTPRTPRSIVKTPARAQKSPAKPPTSNSTKAVVPKQATTPRTSRVMDIEVAPIKVSTPTLSRKSVKSTPVASGKVKATPATESKIQTKSRIPHVKTKSATVSKLPVNNASKISLLNRKSPTINKATIASNRRSIGRVNASKPPKISIGALKNTPASFLSVKTASELKESKSKAIVKETPKQAVKSTPNKVLNSARTLRQTPSSLSAVAEKRTIQSSQKKPVTKSHSPKKVAGSKLIPRKILTLNAKTFYKRASPKAGNKLKKKATPGKTDSKKSTPKASPRKSKSPSVTPKTNALNKLVKNVLILETPDTVSKNKKSKVISSLFVNEKSTPSRVSALKVSKSPLKVTPSPKSSRVSKVLTPKSPIKLHTPKSSVKVQTRKSSTAVQTPKSPIKVQTPKSPVKGQKRKSSTTVQTPTSPARVQILKSPARVPTPKSSIKVQTPKSPVKGQKRKSSTTVQTPPSTRVQTPKSAKVQTPPSTRVQTPKSAKVQTPKSAKVQTPKSARVQTPKSAKVQTPKSAEVQTPKSPARVPTPKSSIKVQTPKSPVKGQKRKSSTTVQTPPSTRVQTPKSAKVQTPKSSIKVQTPKSPVTVKVARKSSANVQTPKSLVKVLARKSLAKVQTKKSPAKIQTPKSPVTVKVSARKSLAKVQTPKSSAQTRKSLQPKYPSKVQTQTRKSVSNVPTPKSPAKVPTSKSPVKAQTPKSPVTTPRNSPVKTPNKFVNNLKSLPRRTSTPRKSIARLSRVSASKSFKSRLSYKTVKSLESSGDFSEYASFSTPPMNVLSPIANKSGRKTSTKSSPIVSPKRSSPRTPDSLPIPDGENINVTPNLSILFDLDASTPKDLNRSRGRGKRVSSLKTISPKGQSSKSFIRKVKTEPRKVLSAKEKIKLRKDRTRGNKSVDQISNSSDATDENAPKTDNEIVITPKSIVKLVPEILREKHSTAKKSTSRKAMIDHLTASPDIVKELFKSPVKRKLSQSIRISSITLGDAQDASIVSAARDLSFDSSTNRKTISPKVTPRVLMNSSTKSISSNTPKQSKRTSRGSTGKGLRGKSKTPLHAVAAKSKSVGKNKPSVVADKVKQLAKKAFKSPKNDLTDVLGVKRLLKTPKAGKSPKNDLTNVKGVKRMYDTPRPSRSPKNDLTNIVGVKNLMKSPRAQKSPKNDLSNVGGVKKLMATPKQQKSPKNDLRNVSGVKNILKTPRAAKSPKNDLSNVGGVKKLLATPKNQRTPKNDLTDIVGVKKLLKSPRSPVNNLLDISGVGNLFQSPRKSANSPKKSIGNVSERSKSDNLFDSLIGKSPLKTYSKSPTPSKKASTSTARFDKSSDSNDLSNMRSRRQITIEKTNFSIEVSKADLSKRPNISILGQSTPAKTRTATANMSEINIKLLSPILSAPKTDSSPSSSSKKLKSTRNAKVASIKKEVSVEGSPGNRRGKRKLHATSEDIIQPRKGRQAAKKAAVKDVNSSQDSKLERSVDKKKKVTFASDVTKVADDRPTKARKTRSTSAVVPNGNKQVSEKGSKDKKKKAGKKSAKQDSLPEDVKSTQRGRKRGSAEEISPKDVKKIKKEAKSSKNEDVPKTTVRAKRSAKAAESNSPVKRAKVAVAKKAPKTVKTESPKKIAPKKTAVKTSPKKTTAKASAKKAAAKPSPKKTPTKSLKKTRSVTKTTTAKPSPKKTTIKASPKKSSKPVKKPAVSKGKTSAATKNSPAKKASTRGGKK